MVNGVWVMVIFALNGAIVMSNPTESKEVCNARAAYATQVDRGNTIHKAECLKIMGLQVSEENFLLSVVPEGFDKNAKAR